MLICAVHLNVTYNLPFSKNGSALYNQEVDCQRPAACLWWHLIAWSAGSYQCASLLVSVLTWAPQQQQWQPLSLLCAPPHTKPWIWRTGSSGQNKCAKAERKQSFRSTRPHSCVSFLDNKYTTFTASKKRHDTVNASSAIQMGLAKKKKS